MNTFNPLTDKEQTALEKALLRDAQRLPKPSKPVPVSPLMEKRRQRSPLKRWLSCLWYQPAWRTALLAVALLCAGATTVLAANPSLREAVIRFLTSGTVEEPPIEALTPGASAGQADTDPSASGSEASSAGPAASAASHTVSADDSGTSETDSGTSASDSDPDGSVPPGTQTAGSLTLILPASLDSHITAMYVSSPDFLDMMHTPSGTALFCTAGEDGVPTYYRVEDSILEEIQLPSHSLTASLQPGRLPGLMSYGGDTASYEDLALPEMEFTVSWQQYGDDILIHEVSIEDCWNNMRFDIEGTFGGDVGGDMDGGIDCRALAGQRDLIEVSLSLDYQTTEYSYPFLLDLNTGAVRDPLAAVDLSAYPCITDLRLSDDLTSATAMAGTDHDSLREITVDLTTGQCKEAPLYEAPVRDCLTWFPVSDHTFFYATGTEESADGFLYDSADQSSVPLFTDTVQGYAIWEDGFAERYFSCIGGGYILYYEGDAVFLLDLHDNSRTLLENIPVRHDVHYFFNPDFTVLSISIGDEDPDTADTSRLCFLDLGTKETWYFDRDLPEGIHETSAGWYSDYGYRIWAKNETTDYNYLYLYEYTP